MMAGKLVQFRVPPEVWRAAEVAAEEAGIAPRPPGRGGKAGGAPEFAKRALYAALGLPEPADAHEELSRARKGQPNPHHPGKGARKR